MASIGYFIPGRLIRAPPLGMLNAHPSLLPRYRGASPIQYTIMNGDTRSGVTIIDLDSRTFDAGNIWAQEERDIKAYQDFRVLEEELAVLSGDLFSRVLADLSRHAVGHASLVIHSNGPEPPDVGGQAFPGGKRVLCSQDNPRRLTGLL